LLLLLVATSPIIVRDRSEGGVNVVQGLITGIGLSAAVLMQIIYGRRKESGLKLHRGAFGCFVAFMVCTLLAATNSWSWMHSSAKSTFAMVLVFVAVSVSLEIGIAAALRALHIATVFYCMLGLVAGLASPTEFPLFQDSEFDTRVRLGLMQQTPVYTAFLSGVGLLAGLDVRSRWAPFRQVLLLTCHILTFTRWGFVCLLGCYLVHLLTRTVGARKMHMRAVLVSFIAALACAAIGILDATGAGEITARALQTDSGDLTDLNGRAELWASLAAEPRLNWVFGHGLEGHREILRSISEWADHAHNVLIELLLSAGFAGAVFCLVAIAMVSWRWLSSPPSAEVRRSILPVFAFALLDSTMDPNLLHACGLIVMGLVMVQSRVAEHATPAGPAMHDRGFAQSAKAH
jgi:O-antigen ligase